MKLKKEKTATKRLQSAAEETNGKILKPAKKMKLQNGLKAKQQQSEATVAETVEKTQPLKIVDNSIFQHFKQLTHEEEQKRMEAALLLLQQLSKTKQAEKREKELAYTLKRLVRGCGASTNNSRAGFFTGLVAFLKAFGAEEISMSQIFDTLQKELRVGATIANKEDADAVVGKILTCGALLHAGRLANVSAEHLELITNILLQSTKQRSYHTSLGFSFLIELLQVLTAAQFESAVWPQLQKELVKPWPKQSLQTIHCLIATQQKFPHILDDKFLKTHFGGAELLNSKSFSYLQKIFWDHSNTNILTHPAFEHFGAHIANNQKLSEFWLQHVDPALETPTKLLEIETLKILSDILNNLNVSRTAPAQLLSPNFMYMLIEGLKNLKQKKDETLKAFYAEFFEALLACCTKLTDDEQKVAVIRRLLMPPGAFNIEKYTSTRIVHQLINLLGEAGVKDVFELYRSIFLGKLAKNPENAAEQWLNFERLNAGYMLQHLLAHKAVQTAYAWREQQLRFFFSCGMFYVDESLQLCKKDAASSFSADFAEQCKNMFFTSLQSKLTDLAEEKQLLFKIAFYCNEKMQQKHAAKQFRIKNFDENLQKSWQSMFEAVNEPAAKTPKKKEKLKQGNAADKLQLVFHILLLNMGLQLFREPDMATPAIEDLLKCMQRTKEQQKKQVKKTSSDLEQPEPEWIEVVVDLFLHLLSQNASALRNIVNALFPHLCGSLNLSAVHQILAMLDMKDGQNPLSAKGEESDEEEEEEEEEEEDEVDNEELSQNGSDMETDEDDEDEEEDDDDDDDDDEEEEEEDEEITATDKLRNAVSQALIDTNKGKDSDMESVDLNDMTEEEGRKLDEALANAFKAMKKTTGSAAQSKKSKSYRVKTTTVMHFRIRVLDLIEIYLQQKPNLLISIEIMLALFNMLEYCHGDELQPLQNKTEKVLQKLTTIKTYTQNNAELNEENLVDFVRLIVEKKAPVLSYDVMNKMRNKCLVFLIGNAQKFTGNSAGAAKVLALCQQYLQEFIKSRNPLVNITLLSDIFKLRWQGVWDLAATLAKQGLTMQTRTFRRIQVYEILAVLYKNNELQRADNVAQTKKHFQLIEKALLAHIEALAYLQSTKQSSKEFQTLLELLLQSQKANARLNFQSSLTTKTSCDLVQAIRQRLRLESTQLYQRYCGAFKLQVIRNSELQNNVNGQNGHDQLDDDSVNDSDSDEVTEAAQKSSEVNVNNKSKAQKRQAQQQQQPQHSAKDLRKQKKLKKQQRMEAASRGLNNSFIFGQKNKTATPENNTESESSDTS